MATVSRFEDLEMWQLARDFCKEIGELIDKGVFEKNFALIDQLNRSSGSIMDNIAEGFERGTRAEFILFLRYSKASAGESRSQIIRAFDRKYISEEQLNQLKITVTRISAAIQKFMAYLRQTSYREQRDQQYKK